MRARGVAIALAAGVLAACGGSDSDDANRSEILSIDEPPTDVEPAPKPDWVDDVTAAIDAVEDELGAGQVFFEVTSNAALTNVFVAVDDGTAAVPYLFVDGELQPPAPKVEGASGNTFTAADVDFDPDRIVGVAQAQLPESTVDSLSVVGNAAGATYVLSATSASGAMLDIVVGPDGTVFSVDPI